MSYKEYKLSIDLYVSLKEALLNKWSRESLISGYGVMDAWLLRSIQYYIANHVMIDMHRESWASRQNSPVSYMECIQFFEEGRYIRKESDTKKSIYSDRACYDERTFIYVDDNIAFDEEFVAKRLAGGRRLKKLNFRLCLKVSEDIVARADMKRVFKEDLERMQCTGIEDVELLSRFLAETCPLLYFVSKKSILVSERGLLKNIKLFVRTSRSIVDCDLGKILGSIVKETDGELWGAQHGGNSGPLRYNSPYFLDRLLSSRYLSNEHSVDERNTPIGGLYRSLWKKRRPRYGIVFAAYSHKESDGWLISEPRADTCFRRYVEDFMFFTTISPGLRARIVFFAGKNSIGLLDKKLSMVGWQNMPLRSPVKRIYRSLFRPELVIATYNGSIQDEAMVSDIPCILFLQNEYEFSPEMNDCIQDLRDAGVLHNDGKSLGIFLNSLESINAWWKDSKTQKAVKKYMDRFAVKKEAYDIGCESEV